MDCCQRCDNFSIYRSPIANIVQDKIHLNEQCMDARLIWDELDSQLESCDVHRLFISSTWHSTTRLVSLISHCILIWTFYEGWLMDSLVVVVLAVLVPFLLWYLTLAMATIHLLKPCRTPSLVKLSLLWDWDGRLPKSKHHTHKNRKTSTWALVQWRSKNTNHFWFYSVLLLNNKVYHGCITWSL